MVEKLGYRTCDAYFKEDTCFYVIGTDVISPFNGNLLMVEDRAKNTWKIGLTGATLEQCKKYMEEY